MKATIYYSLLCLFLGSHLNTQAQPITTRFVSTTGTNTDPASASSWATSTTNLQGAIDAVATAGGGQVWVAAGIYKPTSNTADQGASFAMRNGVAIYGGFAGNETSLSDRPPTNPVATEGRPGTPSSTTLSGDLLGDDEANFTNRTDNSYHVFNHPDGTTLDNTAVLDGVVITAGSGNSEGSGMYNWRSSPTIRNTRFVGNQVSGGFDNRGGAIYNFSSSPVLTNCSFVGNRAAVGSNNRGGAIFNDDSRPQLTNCSFQGNQAAGGSSRSNQGGAIYNAGSSPQLTNCSFQGNQASGSTNNRGGAIYNVSSSPQLTNCSFQGNQVSGGTNQGGAIYNLNRSSPVLTNCSFQGNQVSGGFDNRGGAIYNENRSSPVLTNCSFVSNQGSGGSGSFNFGGAIYNRDNCSPQLTNCSFQGNQASGGSVTFGGAIYNESSSSPVLTNCSFVGNQASGGSDNRGGAIFNQSSSSPQLTNCSFQGNQVSGGTNQGGAIYNAGSSPQLTNCVLFDNGGGNTIVNAFGASVSATYSLFEAGVTNFTDGGNNITGVTSSPFASPTSTELSACAPAINAGSNEAYAAANGPTTDLASNNRFFNGGRIDMGAYEFQGESGQVAITAQPPSGSAVCAGGSITVLVSITGTATAYQWTKDGNSLPGQTAATLVLNSVQAGDAGSYQLTITGACNSVTSTAFSLSVNTLPPVPRLLIQGAPATQITLPQYSGNVTLEARDCTGQLTWQGPAASSGTTSLLLLSTTLTGSVSYSFSCQLNNCTSAQAVATITVVAAPLKLEAPHYDCATRRLTLRTSGGNGQPLEYQIPSVTTGWEPITTSSVLDAKHIGRELKLRARQRRTSGGGFTEVEVRFTATACAVGARLAADARVEVPLAVRLLGNPVQDGVLRAEVTGAEGQRLAVELIDSRGVVVHQQSWPAAASVQAVEWSISPQAPGLLLLRASIPGQQQTLKVLRP